MNKKILAMFVILLLLLLSIGVLYFSRKGGSIQSHTKELQNQEQPTIGQSNTGNKTESIEATLKSLLSMGKSLKCTFSNNIKDASINGTVYAANGKVRQDFQTTSIGNATSNHLIVDSSNTYMWTDGSNQGFKFAIDQASTGPASSGYSQSQTQDINKSMNFSCQGWSADNSFFVLPTNVTFQSFTIPVVPSTIKSSTGSGVSAPNSACSACDNLPEGDARNTCRTQLDC